MPQKPAKPCRYERCPKLTRSQSGYCEQHRKLRNKQYNRHERDQEQNAYYQSKEWKELRALKLKLDPKCVACGRDATVVDHIEPRTKGGKDELENLQSLCKECHSRKTMVESPKRGRRRISMFNYRYGRWI